MALILTLPKVGAVPVVKNGSFENVYVDGVYNPSALPDWVVYGVCGINPNPDAADSASPAVSRPFADNGITPHGKYVAFLQCAAANHAVGRDLGDVRFLQLVDGFESNKTYVVQYFINKNSSGTTPSLYLTINNVDLDERRNFGSVEAQYSYTRPYQRCISREFLSPTNNAYQMNFVLEGKVSPPVAAIQDQYESLPPEVTNIRRNGGVLLLDDVRIIELGNLKLEEARRPFKNHQEVTVKFSDKLDPSTATNLLNYTFSGGHLVLEAKLQADEKTVVLKTSPIPDFVTVNLTVQGILDPSGKGMFRRNATVPVNTAAYIPVDFTQNIQAFSDDFNALARDPNWIVVGEDVFSQADGLMTIKPGATADSYLLYEADYSRTSQKVLARVRFRNWVSGEPLGVASLIDKANPNGNVVGPLASGSSRKLKIVHGPTSNSFGVEAMEGAWYWLRLTFGSQNEVIGKLWLDDPDIPEPSSGFSLPSTVSDLSGLAGLKGSPLNAEAIWEFDYILIQAENLPEIRPELPQPAPPRLLISQEVDDLIFRWKATKPYRLQYTLDLMQSFQDFPADPVEEPVGSGDYILRIFKPVENHFFKLTL